jgi:hypothetical protein
MYRDAEKQSMTEFVNATKNATAGETQACSATVAAQQGEQR